MDYFIGIDPGKKGAVGITGGGVAIVTDCPATTAGMAKFVRDAVKDFGPCSLAALEKVHSMPKQGVKSTFSFGENFGIWQGILATLEIPVVCPTPQQWMKTLLIPKKAGKDVHVQVAAQHFPKIAFHGVRGGIKDGRADAMLLAKYAQLWQNGHNNS